MGIVLKFGPWQLHKMQLLVGVFISVIIGCVYTGQSATALEHPHWMTGDITTEVVDPSLIADPEGEIPLFEYNCIKQEAYIGSTAATKQEVCVHYADGFRYGRVNYYVDGVHYRYTVVGLPGEDRLHYVKGLPFDGIVYIPNSKDLVYIGRGPGSTTSRGVFIIKDFVRQLESSPITETVGGFAIHPDSIKPLVADEYGRAVYTSVHGVSSDGKYLAVFAESKFLVRINMTTYEKALYRTSSLSRVYSGDLLIHTDGETVILGGGRDVARIISLSSECGRELGFYSSVWANTNSELILSNECSERFTAPLLDSVMGDEVSGVYRAQLNYDGGVLTVMAMTNFSYNKPIRKIWVELSVEGYVKPSSIQYLALGDSYSSGEGDIELKTDGSSYYLPGTENQGRCHLSQRSYPYLLRSMFLIDAERMKSVACSGAQMVMDYDSNASTYLGQKKQLMTMSTDEINLARDSALDVFTPGVVPQIEFVKRHKPAMITLTGGGNDVGFGDILKYCASPSWEGVFFDGTCGYAVEGSDLERILYSSIDTQYVYAKSLIERIKKASPLTEINIIGYPSFVANDSLVGCGLNAGFLDDEERRMINDSVAYMNSMLSRVAYDTGVRYVDVENSLEGGRICEGAEYVTGIADVGLDKTYNKYYDETFHPNSIGHEKMANEIYSQISLESSPVSADYESENTKVVKQRSFVENSETIVKISPVIEISFDEMSFAANSDVSIAVHSDVIDLGSFTTNSDGSALLEVDISNVPIGRHVILASGETFTKKEVTYYQFIEVGENLVDADGDGIPDDDDRCIFIKSWYDENTGVDTCNTQEFITDEMPGESPHPEEKRESRSRAYHAVYNMINKCKFDNADKLRMKFKINGFKEDIFLKDANATIGGCSIGLSVPKVVYKNKG